MTEVSLFRLYLLRAVYAFVAIGAAATFWPPLFRHGLEWPLMNSVVCALLAAMSLLAALGIRYPLRMLPVLLFELLWKIIWLSLVALPLWRAGRLDPAAMETVWNCLVAVILIPAIPWRYVVENYVKRPGDRWTAREKSA
jgi:hypothetical protein